MTTEEEQVLSLYIYVLSLYIYIYLLSLCTPALSIYVRSLSLYIYLALYILTAEEEQAPMQQWGLRAGETVAVDAYPQQERDAYTQQEREGRASMGLTPGIARYLHAHVAGQAEG